MVSVLRELEVHSEAMSADAGISADDVITRTADLIIRAAKRGSWTPEQYEKQGLAVRNLFVASVAACHQALLECRKLLCALARGQAAATSFAERDAQFKTATAQTVHALSTPLIHPHVTDAAIHFTRTSPAKFAWNAVVPRECLRRANELRADVFTAFTTALAREIWLVVGNDKPPPSPTTDIHQRQSKFCDLHAAFRSVLTACVDAFDTTCAIERAIDFTLGEASFPFLRQQLPDLFEAFTTGFCSLYTATNARSDKPFSDMQPMRDIVRVCAPLLLRHYAIDETNGAWVPRLQLIARAPQNDEKERKDETSHPTAMGLLFASAETVLSKGTWRIDAICSAFEDALECAEAGARGAKVDDRSDGVVRTASHHLSSCSIGDHFSTLSDARDIRSAVHSGLRVLQTTAALESAPVRREEGSDLTSPGFLQVADAADWLSDWVVPNSASAPNTPASRRRRDQKQGSPADRGAQRWGRESYARNLPHKVQAGTRALVGTTHKLARFFGRERQELADARAFVRSQREGASLDQTQRDLWTKVQGGLRVLLEHAVNYFEGQVSLLTYDAEGELCPCCCVCMCFINLTHLYLFFFVDCSGGWSTAIAQRLCLYVHAAFGRFAAPQNT